MTPEQYREQTFRISIPPSTDGLFSNIPGKGRVKTKAYAAWLETAGWEIKAQRPTLTPGRVSVDITVGRKSNLSDLDNRAKAVLDLLVKQRVIEDDNRVSELRMRWVDAPDCVVIVRPEVPVRVVR